MSAAHTELEIFKTYIVGDFDNLAQIREEQSQGTVVHACARHVNRIAHGKMRNLPPDLNGFFIIEESYYTHPNGEKTTFHHLFLFRETASQKVQLVSYETPPGYEMADLTNDNSDLVIDYATLQKSPFKPLTYDFDRDQGAFSGRSVNPLPEGKEFTLEEHFTPDTLVVTECMRINGKVVNNSDQPTVYKRAQ